MSDWPIKKLPSRFYDVEQDFGAIPDAFFTDGVITNTSATFTSATAAFTAADVGKTILIIDGYFSERDFTTTISAFTNSTTVTLATTSSVSRNPCRFLLSRGGDQTAAIQAAIDTAALYGGGEVRCPGVGYLISGLVVKNRVTLSGHGIRATCLHMLGNTAVPAIRNDYTTNNSAGSIKVKDMWIDGNQANQFALDATINHVGGYTPGDSTLILTDASLWPQSGAFLSGSNRLQYSGKSGNTLTGVVGGMEGTTDATATNGSHVYNFNNHCIYISRYPLSTAVDEELFDPHHTFENVLLKNAHGNGFAAYGMSEMRFWHVWANHNSQFGLQSTFDSFYSSCTAAWNGRAGFYLLPGQIMMNNCKTFYNGRDSGSEGHGFFLEAFNQPVEGNQVFSSCLAQDNKAYGFYLKNTDRAVLSACGSSSNSTSSAGTYAGVKLQGVNNSLIDVICTERKADGSTNWQTHALEIDAASTANQIRITHGPGAAAAAVSTAITAASDLSGGNDLLINGMGGVVKPAFASTITPDPYVATNYRPGALTGNVTIGAPTNNHYGCPLTVTLVQDATGGRSVTWNAAFKVVSPIDLRASGVSTWEFIYDGTNWVEQRADAGGYPTNLKLTADLSATTSTTLANSTGLSFSVVSGLYYKIRALLVWRTATATTGIKIGATTPTFTIYSATVRSPVAADGTAAEWTGALTSSGDSVAMSGGEATSTDYLAILEAVLVPSASGTFQIQHAAEVAAAGNVTMRQGSMLTYEIIN